LSILTNSWENTRAWWTTSTPTTRAAATGVALLLVIGLIMAVVLAASPDYVVIYRGIQGKDAAAMETVLQAKGIVMHYSDADQSVSVPSKDESNAIMYVEAAGVISKDAQIADPGPFGAFSWTDSGSQITDARVNSVREGEIAQMLSHLDPVQSADVKLTGLSDATQIDNDDPASASVVLTLRAGDTLDSDQAKGIASLVARSESGLDVKNVTVTDQTGTPLWPDSGTSGSSDQDSADDRYAARLQARLQRLLDTSIGAGKSQVTVNAVLDFDQIQKEIVAHVPTVPGGSSALPSDMTTHTQTYTGAGAPGVGGPAGVSSNIPSYTTSSSSGSSGMYKMQDEVVKYVDNVDTTQITAAPGSLKQLMVGVLIDTSVPASTATVFQKEFSILAGVSAADPTRQVIVQQIPFDTSGEKLAAAAAQAAKSQALMSNGLRCAAVIAVALILLFLATRGSRQAAALASSSQFALAGEGAHIGLMASDTAAIDEAMLEERPLRIEDVLAEMPDIMPTRPRRRAHAPAIEEQQDLKLESVQEMISGSPQSVALLLKGWMVEDIVKAA
jgi:flagellar M-ring protein FliF